MWQQVNPSTGPRFVTWAQIAGQAGATAGPLLIDGAPLPVGVQTLGDAGVLWTFDGTNTEALACGLRATLTPQGVELKPDDPDAVDVECAFCKAKGEALELYGWTRPPEGWLTHGDRVACSTACAMGAELRLGFSRGDS